MSTKNSVICSNTHEIMMESKRSNYLHINLMSTWKIASHILVILFIISRLDYTLAHCRGYQVQAFITAHNNYSSPPLFSEVKSNVTKKELIAEVAADLGKTQKEVAAVVDTFFQRLVIKMGENKQVMIPKFGVFSNSLRGERRMRNLQTGETFIAPPVHVPILRFYDTFKLNLNDSIKKKKHN